MMTTIAFKSPRVKIQLPKFYKALDASGWDFLANNDAESVDPETITGRLFCSIGERFFYAERHDGAFYMWERV